MPRLRIWKSLVCVAIFMWILLFLFGLHKFYSPNIFKAGFRQWKYISDNRNTAHNYNSNGNSKWPLPIDRNSISHNSKMIDTSLKLKVHSKSKPQKSLKMWFMNEGNLRPQIIKRHDQLKLWPEEADRDRIVDQLMYLQKNYVPNNEVYTTNYSMPYYRDDMKYILLVGDFKNMYSTTGNRKFIEDKCPVNTCWLHGTLDVDDVDDDYYPVNAIIFKEGYMGGIHEFINRTPDLIWILYLLESPVNNRAVGSWVDVFNWTASYRHDSEIVIPYDKFLPYDVARLYAPTKTKTPEPRNYAANKTKKVAWLVSNCHTENRRLEYAEYLGYFIQVDIYGQCGLKSCPRGNTCLDILGREYKFYLAFENSNCKEYITEKFFHNALRHNMLPIVMGPPREDYERVAPPHSFIHVNDFPSAKELAHYLHVLDQNDTLYNEYFEWKNKGEFVNTYFWCRLCAMLHAPLESRSYENMKKWWSGPGICKA